MLALTKAEGELSAGSKGQLAGKTADGLAVVANDHQKGKPTLADAGISKDLSSRAQKLAAVPEKEFEAELAAKRERDRKDGARVSAPAGGSASTSAAPDDNAKVAHEGADLAELLDEPQKELQEAQAQLDAANADDAKAEAMKWQRVVAITKRRQGEPMDT